MLYRLKSFNLFLAIAVVSGLLVSESAHSSVEGARETVVSTIHTIYEEIIANSHDDASLMPVATEVVKRELLPRLHVDKFSKLILAAHWKKASDEQRAEFTRILTEFLLRSFVTAIVSNQDKIDVYLDSITIKDAKPGRRDGRAIVTMLVKYPGTSEKKIDFRMTNEDGDGWKVYDVSFEGVSFAINYRTILNSEIKKSGIDAVTANLGEKLKQ